MTQPESRLVYVAADRLPRWVENFTRHRSGFTWEHVVEASALRGRTDDGSWFQLIRPFAEPLQAHEVPTNEEEWLRLAAAPGLPTAWGVLLVRKGGFAVARLTGSSMVEHKIGQRHVQGRTKAGGQSQQRFARRRDNQARQAYEAAAGHAARILTPLGGHDPLVLAGDDTALGETLAEARLTSTRHVLLPGSIPDPRRAVLDDAVQRAQQWRVLVHNAPTEGT